MKTLTYTKTKNESFYRVFRRLTCLEGVSIFLRASLFIDVLIDVRYLYDIGIIECNLYRHMKGTSKPYALGRYEE